ncbi:hypothetical protein [Halorientalis sp. IM1011]|uniref:hypothetical protein n=1 Tax=Halorientalis sp. IM1011 TaxID=1932360 RepID=UPI0012F743A4|nr:hypothetical protein [Halorientalis sp. IM1011]
MSEMKRRNFIQATGGTALLPVALSGIATASTPESVDVGKNIIAELSLDHSRTDESAEADLFNHPPIITEQGVYLPDYGDLDVNIDDQNIMLFSEGGAVSQLGNQGIVPAIEKHSQIRIPKSPGNAPTHSIPEVAVEKRGEDLELLTPNGRTMIPKGSKKEVPFSSLDHTLNIKNLGEKKIWGDSQRRLFPLIREYDEMFKRVQQRANEKGVSVGEVLSTDTIERSVIRIPEIRAIAIEETKKQYEMTNVVSTEKNVKTASATGSVGGGER